MTTTKQIHKHGLSLSKNDQDIKVTPVLATEDSWVILYENVLSTEQSVQALHELYQDLPWKVEMGRGSRPQSRPTCYFADPECVFTYGGIQLDPQPWHPTVENLKELVTLKMNKGMLDQKWMAPRSSTSSNPHPPSTTHVDRRSSGSDKSQQQEASQAESPLTACLVNLYEEGEGSIYWHADEVRAHGKDKIIASLSIGGPRRFQLRTRKCSRKAKEENSNIDQARGKEVGGKAVKANSRMVADLWLPSGSLLLMMGEVQEKYEHRLPLETEEQNTTISTAHPPSKDRDNHSTINPLRISLTFRSIVPGYENDLKTV